MEFHQQYAHLNLLAVRPEVQGCGIGKSLVVWLEQVAVAAGIGVVYLETPTRNRQARNFYRRLDYKEIKSVPDYYLGRQSAVRLARDLWLTPRSENPANKIKQNFTARTGLDTQLFSALKLSGFITTAHNRTR